jgi:hypothetical protein
MGETFNEWLNMWYSGCNNPPTVQCPNIKLIIVMSTKITPINVSVLFDGVIIFLYTERLAPRANSNTNIISMT